MHSSRILAAVVTLAAGLAVTLVIAVEEFGVPGNGKASIAPLTHQIMLQRVADDGSDQGDGDTDDPPLQPSEQQEEQQEEQQGPGHHD